MILSANWSMQEKNSKIEERILETIQTDTQKERDKSVLTDLPYV